MIQVEFVTFLWHPILIAAISNNYSSVEPLLHSGIFHRFFHGKESTESAEIFVLLYLESN